MAAEHLSRKSRSRSRRKHKCARSKIGERLQELREWSGLSVADAAIELGCTRAYLLDVEEGRRCPDEVRLPQYADVYDCDVNELELLASKFGRRCGEECVHDGEMRPGGLAADRDESCANYDECLSAALRADPNASSLHCPKGCTRRTTLPAYIRLGVDGGQHGDRRWDTARAFDDE